MGGTGVAVGGTGVALGAVVGVGVGLSGRCAARHQDSANTSSQQLHESPPRDLSMQRLYCITFFDASHFLPPLFAEMVFWRPRPLLALTPLAETQTLGPCYPLYASLTTEVSRPIIITGYHLLSR